MKEKEVLALRKVVDHERDALDEQRNEFQITCENFEDEKDQVSYCDCLLFVSCL